MKFIKSNKTNILIAILITGIIAILVSVILLLVNDKNRDNNQSFVDNEQAEIQDSNLTTEDTIQDNDETTTKPKKENTQKLSFSYLFL